ncbi:DNA polymerase III subunit gamma/tau [Maritalea porphyrae]|uniref:DNA polymerase III subunit gamma/tau n=1 Tax=Maritalea porphyrae TaxID=880732 RepID=UPI0022B00807|nr:DNA polymerase III subunit gamma/tau [Maritalea porphyrae]MCZ4271715.1 DNA polymerase III subunit gamma/tau [Maritalea porphyrae]
MADKQDAYLVLARKYRPENFSTFIGQDAMLQTLKNAFSSNRIAHAFMLTGVRGVGKTTTARILARALNFEDDSGPHPSLDLEVDGKHCRAIIESRHVDVIEMDAASHTGIDDIREIIDSVRYGPVSAPYKVFIIDEVHMLSKAAFNGLLKTLEEPPPYVKFIFATTEIRKVPITILSRCQRFDLRRYDPETLQTYLGSILEKEGITFEPEALQLVIRAGEGSARDNLSLLDQAIAHSGGDIKADTVRQMLGLADRSLTLDLFETLMKGDAAGALEQLRHQYDAGADAATVVTDLAATTHLVTRLKVVPAAEKDPVLTPDEKSRGKEMAQKLNIRVLSRTWQILNKGIAEINNAHDAIQAAEMVLIRLAYAADLPTPDELIKKLGDAPQGAGASAPNAPAGRPTGGGGGMQQAAGGGARMQAVSINHAPQASPVQKPTMSLNSFAEIVALCGEKRELVLKHALEANVSPISVADGRIEIALTPEADQSVASQLSQKLKEWTNRPWLVTVSKQKANDTIRQQRDREAQEKLDKAMQDPSVKAILAAFPGARLVNEKSLIDDEPVAEEWLDDGDVDEGLEE